MQRAVSIPSLVLRPRAIVALIVAPLAALAGVAPLRAQGADSASAAGQRLFLARRYAEARVLLERAVATNPRDSRALLDLGRIGVLAHDPKGAERWLERAADVAPDDPAVHEWLARAYTGELRHAGRFRQLVLASRIHENLLRAAALDPASGAAALAIVRFDLEAPGIAGGSRSRARDEARALVRHDAYHGHLALGYVAEKGGDAAAAERELRAALDAAPDSTEPYYQLGYLYQRQQRYDDAFRVHDALLARHPDELGADYEIGRTAAFSGERLDRASAALERFLRESDGIGTPPVQDAHYWLGVIRERQGAWGAARAEWERALALQPDYADARAKLDSLGRAHPGAAAVDAAPDRLALLAPR